jgi:heme-degrading monooxygenase HmoA
VVSSPANLSPGVNENNITAFLRRNGENAMPSKSTTASRPGIARIWRGRTTRAQADAYEAYNYEAGIKPLIEKAMGVQTFREDRAEDTEFMTISYWQSVEAMSSFTGSDPAKIHHLERDKEFLIELPKSVQILRLRHSHGDIGSE